MWRTGFDDDERRLGEPTADSVGVPKMSGDGVIEEGVCSRRSALKTAHPDVSGAHVWMTIGTVQGFG